MIALLAVSLSFNGATTLGTQILRRASPPLALKGCSPFDDSTPDGGALFKVYEAGEEDERPVVADRTKLLFALIFTLPTLAVLLSIATYDPPSVGEVADAARSAGERAALDELTDSVLTLRGGALQLPQRRQLLTLGLAAALASPPPRAARADADASILFAGGDTRFLQYAFDKLSLPGVTSEAGVASSSLGELPAVRLQYDPARTKLKRLLGQYWRSIDPTAAAGSFGDAGPNVIWASEADRPIAETSRRRLGFSGLFYDPKAQTRRAIATQIADAAGAKFTAAPEEEQHWAASHAEEFAKLDKATGRAKWFEKTYKPYKTDACENRPEVGGMVCGYVYFPCDDECLAVINGSW